MLRDSTTASGYRATNGLWCQMSAECLPMTAKRKLAGPLLVATDIHEIDFNSFGDSIICPHDTDGPATSLRTSALKVKIALDRCFRDALSGQPRLSMAL
jgi:hypothetical protein